MFQKAGINVVNTFINFYTEIPQCIYLQVNFTRFLKSFLRGGNKSHHRESKLSFSVNPLLYLGNLHGKISGLASSSKYLIKTNY